MRQQNQGRPLASKSEHRSLPVHLGEGDLVLALEVRKLARDKGYRASISDKGHFLTTCLWTTICLESSSTETIYRQSFFPWLFSLTWVYCVSHPLSQVRTASSVPYRYNHLGQPPRAARALAKKKSLMVPRTLYKEATGPSRFSSGCSQQLACFLRFPLTLLYLEFILGHLLCLAIHTEGQHTLFIF